jgi:16S rRNA (guanine1207-N2)-methyltransferase
LLRWLARLAPHGIARLVVGKNLGSDTLQRWLTEQGYDCERIASAKGFRVLVVRAK